MDEIINKLIMLEDLAVRVQALAYFNAPSEKGCAKGHMGHMGFDSGDGDKDLINHYIYSISVLLQAAERDLKKASSE